MAQSAFEKYKQSRRNVASTIEKIKEKTGKNKDFSDGTADTWQYTRDKVGNAFAIIRFLPNKNPDDSPMVMRYEHSFQNKGQWYIENCPTTFKGESCPCCSVNNELWDAGLGDKIVRKQGRSRKTYFFANIYVVKDDANPEAVGKVFPFRFGKKVYEKIMSAGQSDFEGEETLDAFDPLEGGANFKLKIKTVKDKNGNSYPNYDECAFMSKSALEVSDEEFEKIFETLYDINQYVDPTNKKLFKQKEYLEKRIGIVTGKTTVAQTVDDLDETEEETEPEEETVETPVETEDSDEKV